MADIVIDVSELRKEDSERVKELREFLGAKLGVDVTVEDDKITLSDDVSSKPYLRVLVRRFLHKSGLKEEFRPISDEGNIKIKKKRKPKE